jgi:hypothetical protein
MSQIQQEKEESQLKVAEVKLPTITTRELLIGEGFKNGEGASVIVDKKVLAPDDVLTKGTKYIILPAIAGGF